MVSKGIFILGVAAVFIVSASIIGVSIYLTHRAKDHIDSSRPSENVTNNPTTVAGNMTMTSMMNSTTITTVHINSSTLTTTISITSPSDTNKTSIATTNSVSIVKTQNASTNTTSITSINSVSSTTANEQSIRFSSVTSSPAVSTTTISSTSMPFITSTSFTTTNTTSMVLTSTDLNCQLAFMPMVSYTTNARLGPVAVTVADFNNDSYLDIVVANEANSSIGILLGNHDATFQSERTFYVGNNTDPVAIAVGDFNQDQQLDTVVSNMDAANIAVLLGNGDGTFIAQKPMSTGGFSYPAAVTVGYFNNDTILDIAVANSGTNRIGIFIGNGNGTFQNQKVVSTGSNSEPSGVAVGDFNHDSYVDLVVANHGSNKVSVLLGYGNGSFRSQISFSSGIGPYWISVSDFNGDHNIDIAVVNTGSDSLSILLGFGNGTFDTQMTYFLGDTSETYFFAIADVNRDGRQDIIVPNVLDDNFGILLGNGDGTFQTQIVFSTGLNSGPASLAIANFNNDNRPDIVVTNYDLNEIGIFFGTC